MVLLFEPRIHFRMAILYQEGLEFHSPLNMDEQNLFILYSSEKKQNDFYDEWPCAIAKDIEKL